MRRRISILAGVVVAGVIAALSPVANADGMPSKGRVVYDTPATWSGFYIGSHTGYAWSSIDARFTDPPNLTYSVDDSQAVYGLQIGLQHQWDKLVVGVEGYLSFALRDVAGVTTCPNNLAWNCTERFDDVFTLGARLGWANGVWMPYITGGYASGAFAHRTVVASTNVPVQFTRDRYDGWYIGGGLDWIVYPNWVLGLEYRHYDFDSGVASPNDVNGIVQVGQQRTFEPTLDTVTLRLSWKFDRQDREPAPLK
jgi:outer membrane immunogenic protein